MSLLKRYAKQINGVYSCFDRVVINGTLPGFCYAEGMTSTYTLTSSVFLIIQNLVNLFVKEFD